MARKSNQAFVGEAAGDGDRAAFQIGKSFDRAVLFDDDGAAIAMAEIHHLDRNALRSQGNGQGRNNEGRLHLIGDQRFLDFRKALEHARQKHLAVLREFRDVVGHRASELAGDRKIGDSDLALGAEAIVIENGRPS